MLSKFKLKSKKGQDKGEKAPKKEKDKKKEKSTKKAGKGAGAGADADDKKGVPTTVVEVKPMEGETSADKGKEEMAIEELSDKGAESAAGGGTDQSPADAEGGQENKEEKEEPAEVQDVE